MAKKLAFDRWLFTSIVLLLVFGLVMVYSASGLRVAQTDAPVLELTPFNKQLIAACLGLVGMFIAMQFDYRRLREPWMVYLVVLAVVALLVIVLFSPQLNNSRRWIFLFGFSLQPSELAKLALVVYLAYQLERKSDRVNSSALLVPSLVVMGLLGVLVLLQPDLGTTAMLIGMGALLLFLGGVAWRYVLGGLALAAPALLAVAVLDPRRWQRITSFLDDESNALAEGWQVSQSLIAIGSGGISGVGLGQSVQKQAFLPMANTDFIFSVVCEEWGFIGAVALLGLFGFFAWRGFRAGDRAPDRFGRHLAWGLTAMLVGQAFLHMSIALKLVPTTGVTLPFVSYGGSSLIMTLAAAGVLLNVSQHA